jgi:hypothetical protein
MTGKSEFGTSASGQRSFIRRFLSNQWEILLFLVISTLILLQVYLLYVDIHSLSDLHGAIALFADFDSFIVHRLSHVVAPAVFLPLLFILFCGRRPAWVRRYLDILGGYLAFRMTIQLIGLNILVFDSVTQRYLLITQLLVFLPYSLMVWGWIYWRLDVIARASNRQFFRLDCEGGHPRPIDYIVASFSSVFSATISGIKGNSARARILILAHGFMIYDIMVLTLSRAVALVQSR